MTSTYKKTWGKSKLRYCPISKQVWQYKYNSNTKLEEVVIFKDMPSYGLDKLPIPEDCVIKKV
jgi:hypothetical protein